MVGRCKIMSDEEKKAIKEVKHFNQLTRYWQEEEYEEKEIAGYIGIILNLIEKQSKEIEELKESKEEMGEVLDEWINGERTSIFHIHKDKIKAKIEEIKKSKENIYFEEHLESILQSLLEKE